MAVYLGKNKVNIAGIQTVNTGNINTSDASVSEDTLQLGIVAYGKNGKRVEGTLPATSATYDGLSPTKITSSGTDYLQLEIKPSEKRIIGGAATLSLRTKLSNLGDAIPENVMANTTFTSASGIAIQGTHVCSGGIDTSKGTAEESDIAYGKIAYVDGKEVTGTARNVPSGSSLGWSSLSSTKLGTDSSGNIGLSTTVNESSYSGILWQNGANVVMRTSPENFGDARLEDVVANKTFTSAAGLKQKGTHVCSGTNISDASNVLESQVLEGITVYGANGKTTGTMPQLYTVTAGSGVTVSYTGQTTSQLIGTNPAHIDIKGNPVSSTFPTNGAFIDSNVEIIGSIAAEYFGDATVDDVAENVTFTSINGLKLTGRAKLGSGGVDTSELSEITSSDLAQGKVVYGSNGKVTGSLPEVTSLFTSNVLSVAKNSTDNTIDVIGQKVITQDSIVRYGSGGYVNVKVPISRFGDAKESDVRAGVTFTSENGVKLTGNATIGGSGGTTLPEGAIAIQKVIGAEASTQIGSGYNLSVTYGDDVIIGDSIALEFSGTTNSLSNISSTTDFSVLQGKYVRVGSGYGTSTSTFYYIPSGSTFTVGGSSMSKTLTCDKAQAVSLQKLNL